jgi:hypothetical protein
MKHRLDESGRGKPEVLEGKPILTYPNTTLSPKKISGGMAWGFFFFADKFYSVIPDTYIHTYIDIQ